MKLLLAAIIGIVAGAAAVQRGAVSDFLADIYPTDSTKRQALDLCIFADPNFNRLDRAARDACYRRISTSPMSPAYLTRAINAPNQIDLRQRASVANAPHNDIRNLQRSSGSTP
jgi:hypothetical protein